MAALPRLAGGLAIALALVSSAHALVPVGPRETIPNAPSALVVSRGIAYVASTTGLQILDASDPAAGYTPLGSHPGSFDAVEVRGTLAYVAGPAGLEILDVSDPASPTALGARPLDRRGLDLDVIGGLAYVAVTPFGLRIVDISNPAAPATVGALDLESAFPLQFAAIAVEGGVAYLSTFIGAVSVDVANPAAPALIAPLGFDAFAGGVDLAVRNDILYATANFDGELQPSIRILDVSDPAAPVELSRFASPCTALELAGQVLYCTDPNQLFLFEVSDPSQPRPLGLLLTAGNGRVVDVAIVRGFAHVVRGPVSPAFESSLQAVDTRVRAFPSRTSVPGPPENFYSAFEATRQFLYAAGGGIDVYDIGAPADPLRVGQVAIPGLGRDLALAGDILYAATTNGLVILDVSDPTSPRLLSTIFVPARSLLRDGNFLYVGTLNGLVVVYDIRDRAAPSRVTDVGIPGSVQDLDLAGDVLYATTLTGVTPIDVSDPTAPDALPGKPLTGPCLSSAIRNDLLYVGCRGVVILDRTGSPLEEVGAFDEDRGAQVLQIRGDRLFANSNASLLVFDLSDPLAPVQIGGVISGVTFGLSAAGFAYLSGDAISVLYAVDFGPEYAPTLPVSIDVLPGDRFDRIVVGKPRALPVAIFGSAVLDVRRIDRRSLALGPDGAPALISVPVFANRDRWKDLLAFFWNPDTGIALGDTQVCLTGRLESGRRLRGCDDIRTIEKGTR